MVDEKITTAGTREHVLHRKITDALGDQRPYEEDWKKLEDIYSGDYEVPGLGVGNAQYRYKSNLMNYAIETNMAVLAPQPHNEFQVDPANPNQEPDVNSASTAKGLLEYYFGRRRDYDKINAAGVTTLLKNRCIVRMNVGKTVLPSGEGRMRGVNKAVEASGDAMANQPGWTIVDNKDFICERGYKSIDEAWDLGGMVARRFYPHNEWVKKNPVYNNNRDMKGDVGYKGQEPSDTSNVENYGSVNIQSSPTAGSEELQYNVLWEVFFAPRNKKGWKKGRYIIYNRLQRTILYDEPGMPFKGMRFPFRELVDIEPRRSFNETPRSARSVNFMLTYEWYESKIMQRTDMEKDFIVGLDDAPDEMESWMASTTPVVIAPAGTDVKPDQVAQFPIRFDNLQLERGSSRALSAFERIWGLPSAADPVVRGQQIATEINRQNNVFQFRINKFRVKLNKFIEGIARDMLTITKQDVPRSEQERITRSVTEVWKDLNEVTLEGNYSIKVFSKPLRDQTHGEYLKTLQMAASTMLALDQNPKYAEVTNVVPVMKAFLKELDIPTVGVFAEESQMDQWAELANMMAQLPMDVDPGDDHMGHMRIIDEYMGTLEQTGDQSAITVESEQLIAEHYAVHAQYLQRMQQGAAGMGSFNESSNPTNMMRGAEAANVGGGALSGQ